MDTYSVQPLGDVLFGKTRQALLGVLFMHDDEDFHLRQLVRMTGTALGAAQRELATLASVGLLLRRQRGRQVFFNANHESPVFREMRDLVIKTIGIGKVLRAAIARPADDIRIAFVFGSFARAEHQAASDIDLLVISETVTLGDIVIALKPAQETLHREINPLVYTTAEFGDRLRGGKSFIPRVMAGPKLFVIGDERELKRMAEQQLAEEAHARRGRAGRPAGGGRARPARLQAQRAQR